jgi:glycosyltransferase involved in cell wall biosynthesis
MLIVSSMLLAVIFILCMLFIQLASNVKRYKPALSESDDVFPLVDMPTISLCIPARNETHALEDCLSSVIVSDYPKLEVIVLDDCSQDRTPQIIRGFAQDGIRFVRGKEPSDGWLGKNNAYEVLAREARGKYLIFMSVDTRLEPRTLSRLINYMQTNKLSMVSVLPRRMGSWKSSILFAPLRYFWQVIMPLGLNTPTATSLWAVQNDSLAEIGGFSVHKDNIIFYSQVHPYEFGMQKNGVHRQKQRYDYGTLRLKKVCFIACL